MWPGLAAFDASGLTIFAFVRCGWTEFCGTTDTSSADACVKAKRHANPETVGQLLISTYIPWMS